VRDILQTTYIIVKRHFVRDILNGYPSIWHRVISRHFPGFKKGRPTAHPPNSSVFPASC